MATQAPDSTVDTPNIFGHLWHEAIQRYEKKTGVDPLSHPLIQELSSRNSIQAITDLFERKMLEFKEFRKDKSEWIELRNKYLKPAIGVLIRFIDALSETASYFPVVPGGKAIFVAFGALLAATEGVSKRYDALLDLFEEIPFFLDSVLVRESSTRNWGQASRHGAVTILIHILDIFAMALRMMSSPHSPWKRLAHFGKSLTGTTDMQDALARLRRLTDLEIRAIVSETRADVASNLSETRNILRSLTDAYTMLLKEFTGQLEDERGEERAARIRYQQELAQIRHSQAEAAAKVTLDMLDRLDLADLTAQDRPGCLSETRMEVLTGLATWSRQTDAPRIYWLNGMAGTGKSTIARSFGQQLRHDGILGGSFFCSRESAVELTDTKRIIPTLAAALAARNLQYRSALLSSLNKYSAPNVWRLGEQVQRLLVEPFACFIDYTSPCFVLLIDALDETEGWAVRELLESLVAASRQLPLKFFLTSRPEEHIRPTLSSSQAILRLHDIEKEIVARDIHIYVVHRMAQILTRLESFDLPANWPSDDDVRSLADLSGSLFIHAFTTTEYISGGNPVQRLQEVLDVGHTSSARNHPLSDLDRIYTFILGSVHGNPQEMQLTWRIITAILALKEPITIQTLGRLFNIDIYVLKFALRHLHAVIYVPERNDKGVLSTFHASFGDFLTTYGRAPSNMLLSLLNGHFDILSQCVSVMRSEQLHFNMATIQSSYVQTKNQEPVEIPLHIVYASQYCLEHLLSLTDIPATQVGINALGEILVQVHDIISRKGFFWLEVCHLSHISRVVENQITRLSAHILVMLYAPADMPKLVRETQFVFKQSERIRPISTPHIYLSLCCSLDKSSLLAKEVAKYFTCLPSHGLSIDPIRPELTSDGSAICCHACSPDNCHIAAGYENHVICIWNSQTCELVKCLAGHRGCIKSVAYSSNGLCVASGSSDRTVRIWDSITGQQITRYDGQTTPGYFVVNHIEFLPGSYQLAILLKGSEIILR